jgi:2-dehydro-3-deoxygluconokinase
MMKQTICVIGECMIELQREASGFAYRFGGDTLNTAVYLARQIDASRFGVAYVSALGIDSLSDEMLDRWQEEGIETQWVQRLPDKLPGMYLIETDAKGERRFHYWRNDSAARYWLQGPRIDEVRAALSSAAYIYLSGISLAILSAPHRELLFEILYACRKRGGKIIFDNNYRPRLWPNVDCAVDAYRRALQLSDVALLTIDDEIALHGAAQSGDECDAAIKRALAYGVNEIVIKRGAASCIVQIGEQREEVAPQLVENVVDTTAAGDSFAAAYLASRLQGGAVVDAANAGHALAAKVIQYRGAIIPG